MGWGDAVAQVAGMFNPTLGAGVSFLSNLQKSNEQEKAAKKSENEYYAALAQQKQLAQLAAQTASQRSQFEQAMKDRILSQTGTMGSTLRAAQTAMGAMPQVNQGTINADYQTTKATMMKDFTDMLKLVESQGRSAQIDRLGGAGSMTADNDRMMALMKQYSPELQKIDDAAYDSAVQRSSNTMNLINTNRQNTLKELEGIYNPQITSETNLLSTGSTDATAPTNMVANYASTLKDNAGSDSDAKGTLAANTSASLGHLLGQVFNRPSNNGLYTATTAQTEDEWRRRMSRN